MIFIQTSLIYLFILLNLRNARKRHLPNVVGLNINNLRSYYDKVFNKFLINHLHMNETKLNDC